MIDPYIAKEYAASSIDWLGDFHKLNSTEVESVIAAADQCAYRKPRNANGSRARYFFYAVQRKLKQEKD